MTQSAAATRDGQRRSAFALILERFVESCLGCLAAVLVDGEGEAVDFAGALPAYEAKLAGAHWQIVIRELLQTCRERQSGVGEPRSVAVRTDSRGYLLQRVFGDYVLVVVCLPRLLPTLSLRALSQVEHELRREAEWPAGEEEMSSWSRVSVTCDAQGVPQTYWRAEPVRHALEPVGRPDELGPFERGYRMRTADGARVVLVREPTGFWYLRGDSD